MNLSQYDTGDYCQKCGMSTNPRHYECECKTFPESSLPSMLPTRKKYIDERVGIWHINSGERFADVRDGSHDVFTGLPSGVAWDVIRLHDKFRTDLYALLCPEES